MDLKIPAGLHFLKQNDDTKICRISEPIRSIQYFNGRWRYWKMIQKLFSRFSQVNIRVIVYHSKLLLPN